MDQFSVSLSFSTSKENDFRIFLSNLGLLHNAVSIAWILVFQIVLMAFLDLTVLEIRLFSYLQLFFDAAKINFIYIFWNSRNFQILQILMLLFHLA